MTATQIADFLTTRDIHVLPGTYFFWNARSDGERFIRIALARDPDVFFENMTQLVKSLSNLDVFK